MKNLPLYTLDLLKELDKMFPSRCPHLNESDREIWFYAGRRQLIESLLMRAKEADRRDLLDNED
jgi:hypothetical protein